MWNPHSRKFWDNSKCKCEQGNVILDGIEFRVSKIIYKDICIKVHGIWGCGFVCPSVSFSILKSAIVANAFPSNLETQKSQNFPMVASRRVAKLSTSPEVTIFSPPVPYSFISVQCLKGDRWTIFHIKFELFWEEKLTKV